MSDKLKIFDGGRTAFNELIMSSPHYSFLQSYEWGELKSEFGWIPYYVVRDKHNRAFLLLERSVPVIGKSMVYIPHPYIDDGDVELISGFVREDVGAFMVKLEPIHGVNYAWLDSKSVVSGDRVQPKNTLIVDISRDVDEIMENFHRKTRYNIRLSERRGVKVLIENTDEGFSRFYNLLRTTSIRKRFLVHSREYHRRMYEIFSSSGMCAIFNAYFEGILAASIFVVKFGDTAYYCFGGSEPELSRHMPSHLAHFKAMEWAKKEGCLNYDLWGVPEGVDAKHPAYGLYRFKSGFGGELVKRPGAFDIPLDRLRYRVFRVLMMGWNLTKNILVRGRAGDPMGG
ncbi:MAG: hypothetical protein DRH49_01610 [Candidatus Coatesbacteria bacterium]|nr:MAG: hypothetical protein DRH49_01610 [Candidatus Coatesbacteria bacterium]